LKFLLNLDENKIFNIWPAGVSQMNKIYNNNASAIYPKNYFDSDITVSLVEAMTPIDFRLPQSEYFGIDFSSLTENYLTLKYARGTDYEKKKKETLETIHHIAEKLYRNLQEVGYSSDELYRIKEIIKEQRKIVRSTRLYKDLQSSYRNIHLYVDLNNDPRVIETAYPRFRNKIFELIAYGNIKKGVINYDTDRNVVQVKDTSLRKGVFLEGMEFLECFIEAELQDCLVENCKIRSSTLIDSDVLSNNNIKYSRIKNCNFMGFENNISHTFIDNSLKKIILANLTECVVRKGTVSLESEVDKKTEFIKNKIKKQL